MVSSDNGRQRGTTFFAPQTLLIALAFILPVALPSLFGWLNGLLAVPVFFLFRTTENVRQTIVQIRNGLLLGVGAAVVLQQLVLLVFASASMPLGYSLYRSARSGDTPATAGAKGVAALGISWFLFWAVYGILAGIHPYATLLLILDSSFERVIEIYRTGTELPADVLYNLEQIITSIREFLPKVLPGLLATSVIITVWLNMLIVNYLLYRFKPEKIAWPRFSQWQLPEKLVWLVIAAAMLLLVGSGAVKNAGYSLAIIAAILYCLQGVAVFIHFLDRWKIPGYLRVIVYVILVVQSYGLLLLAMLGVADIWIDFRRLAVNTKTNH